MDVQQMVEGVREALTVRQIFGEPYGDNGVLVVPVANVQGGAGGGVGSGADGTGQGGGAGMRARAAGVYVIAGDHVSWQPALDINRIVAGTQLVMIIALLAARSITKARLKSR